MSYKIIGKYIKDLNFSIPNPKTFFLLTKNIEGYKKRTMAKKNKDTMLNKNQLTMAKKVGVLMKKMSAAEKRAMLAEIRKG